MTKTSIFRHLLLLLTLFILSSCSSAYKIADLHVYDDSKSPVPIAEVEAIFGKPTGVTPIFSFRYVKEKTHSGLPYANEMTIIKQEAARRGARYLILDCPSPGVMGSGMCMVYGYE